MSPGSGISLPIPRGPGLCGDITYLRTEQGWLYLATVIDLSCGMLIGYAMDATMPAGLRTSALQMGRDRGYLAAGEQVVFHWDRGPQDTCRQFQNWCRTTHLTQSMGRTGVCWDNAVAENFFSHLNTEFYHHRSYATRVQARIAVFDDIEACWDSRQRPNARAGGLSPARTLQNHQRQAPQPVAA